MIRHSTKFASLALAGLWLAVAACRGTDGGPTAPNAPPVVPKNPAPATPAPPAAPVPSLAGKWAAVGAPAGIENIVIILTEDAHWGLSGVWTATKPSCRCEFGGDIFWVYTEPGIVFRLTSVGTNSPQSVPFPYGRISGALADRDHFKGSIEISTESGYFEGESTGDVLTLVRVPR